ncbi:MAG: bacillithiol biosynthesis deacetylase BshB1 [Coriobacteriia bacterium]|nr:bacillithiol biosynthesis deacetylase BshB1 [Coriobacteriia bacterium]
MADVICVGAHPDDVEIGMGATAAKLARRGLDVLVLDLTDGEPTPRGTHETRMVEAAASAARLGVRRLTLDLPNRELFDTVAARKRVAEVFRAEKPRLLFAPYPIDSHPDHIAASAIVEAARFYSKFVKTDMSGEPHFPSKVYHYWAVHLRVLEKPSFIVEVADDLDAKLEALACYESQFAANEKNAGIIPWVEVQARSWGALVGVAAGEPFYAREQIGVRDPMELL